MEKAFKIIIKDKHTEARLGEIVTNHGKITTPAFIPDATYGAVKHISSQELKDIGLQIILGNIYHLWLRPGIKTIKKLGGLHKFMNWHKSIITDSGGFQAFSLVYSHSMGKVLEEGVEFKDHLSGSAHFLTPKISIDNQLKINADILMTLDYMVDHKNVSKFENERSVRLTVKWAKICKEYFDKQDKTKGKILMAIIQGANHKALRKKCFQELEKIADFPGYGYGGLPFSDELLGFIGKLIPEYKIRYVMGCGKPKEILKAVSLGWDLFDCVIPTRNARHGLLYTFNGELKIMQKIYILFGLMAIKLLI